MNNGVYETVYVCALVKHAISMSCVTVRDAPPLANAAPRVPSRRGEASASDRLLSLKPVAVASYPQIPLLDGN